MDKQQQIALRQALINGFNLEELSLLCADLEVDSEELSGNSKSARVLSLLQYLQRRNRLDELAALVQQQRPDSPISAASPSSAKVYLSYAWGGDSETLVNQLCNTLEQRQVPYIRDKNNLDYRGSIQAFMREIGASDAIIVVISDKYLKSENCMFELLEISRHGELKQRIFPIVLPDANIYDPLTRLDYIQYWEQKGEQLNDKIKTVNAANLHGIRESIDLYTAIRAQIANLTELLKDMNTLTVDMHQQQDFAVLIEQLMRKIT